MSRSRRCPSRIKFEDVQHLCDSHFDKVQRKLGKFNARISESSNSQLSLVWIKIYSRLVNEVKDAQMHINKNLNNLSVSWAQDQTTSGGVFVDCIKECMKDWENIIKIEDEISQNWKSRLRKAHLIVKKEITNKSANQHHSTEIRDPLDSCSARESLSIVKRDIRNSQDRLEKMLREVWEDLQTLLPCIKREMCCSNENIEKELVRTFAEKTDQCRNYLKTFEGSFDSQRIVSQLDVIYDSTKSEKDSIIKRRDLALSRAFDKFRLAAANKVLDDPLGGWDERAHLIFTNFTQENGDLVVPMRFLLKVINKTEDNVKAHSNLISARSIYNNKCSSAKFTFSRELQALYETATRQVEMIALDLNKKISSVMSKEINDHIREISIDRLSILQSCKNEEEDFNDKVSRAYEKKEAENQKALNKIKFERAKTIKGIVQKYRETKAYQQHEDSVLQIRQAKVERQDKMLRMRLNRQRVIHRQMLSSAKQALVEEKQKEHGRIERERLERINKLAMDVPYYDSIENVKSTFRTKSTASRLNDKFKKDSTGLADFQHGMRKMTSFSNERFFSNT